MHSRFRNRYCLQGMTLIEVLVALVIIAVGLSALIRSVNAGIVNTDYLREKSVAHWLAMNTVAEQQLEQDIELRNYWKPQEMAGRTFQVNTKIAATDVAGILRVEVGVYKDRDDTTALDTVVAFIGAKQ